MSLSRRKFLQRMMLSAASLTLASCTSELPLLKSAEPQIETTDYDVLVIGAGIAGLTAAYQLRQQRLGVLESAAQVGGRTIAGSHGGYTYAKGTEYLGQPEGTLAQIIQELNIGLKEIPSPMDAHFHAGKFYWGDDGVALSHIEACGVDAYNQFVSLMQEAYAGYNDLPDTDLDSALAELDQITVRQWFDRLGVPQTFYAAYNVTCKGLFGATIDEISALSAIAEIAFDFEDDQPIEDVGSLENTPDQPTEHSEAYSCVLGITEITNALALALGNRIRTQATVTSITQQDQQYHVTYRTLEGATQTLTATKIILAVPAPIALQLAAPVLSEEQQQILQQVDYAVYATAALFSQTPIFNQAFDLAVPDDYFFTDVYDATWVQRHYAPPPDPNIHIVSVYVAPPSYRDRSMLDLSDDELLQKVYQSLENIFPEVEKMIIGHDIQRFSYAYPIMTFGAYQRLRRLHELNTENLALAGDYMIYPTFEAAVESGALAAQKLLEA
ncbi:MAG: FAD-dependent oxidoreductase [Anaerolineae bacterium]